MEPLISVALCTYNGVDYLKDQLLSILNQTYKNIEVIVVDDCSSDGTINLLKTFAQDFPQIKWCQNEKNLGFNKNFEKAISLTHGDYIAISDQDDIWMPDKLKLLYQHIRNNWLIFSNSSFIDHQGNDLNKTLLNPDFKLGNRDFRSLLLYNFVTGHTSLIARESLAYIFPIPASGYYDWWIGFVALYHHKMTYLNQVLTLHRIHHTSVMYQDEALAIGEAKKNQLRDVMQALMILKSYKKLNDEDRKLIIKLESAFKEKLSGKYSLYLFQQVFKSYHDFFPDLKYRSLISRLNFAYKFARGFKY